MINTENLNLEEIEEEYYKRFLNYTPNSKQELFHIAGLTAQERLIGGGNRSGKTYTAEQEYARHWTGIYNSDWKGYKFDRPVRCWVAGKTASLIAETLQKDLLGDKEQNLRGILHPSLIKDKKKSGNSEMYRTIYVRHISGGSSKVTFKTYEEGREAFQGSKIDLALLDEEPPFNIYQECKMRTMATDADSRGMIVVSSTFLKGYTDLVNYFTEDRHPEEVKDSRWHTYIGWKDTHHLSTEEKKRLIAGMSPHEIESRTNGTAWRGSGLVYPVPENLILCDPFEIPDYWPRVYGIDFGWNHPAFLFAAHDRDNNCWYFYSEYSVPQRSPDGHATALQSFGINWIPAVYDPAGKGSAPGDGKKPLNLFREAGFKNLNPADNSKEEGILKTLQMMQAGQIKIFTTLVKTRSELGKYARDEDGIPNKKDDHFMDCMRYIVMSGGGVAIPKNFMNQQYMGRYTHNEPSYY
ncbi:MAG: terminase family protein [Pedobacter agri]